LDVPANDSHLERRRHRWGKALPSVDSSYSRATNLYEHPVPHPAHLRESAEPVDQHRAVAHCGGRGARSRGAVLYDELGDLPHFNPDDDVVPVDPAVARLRGAIHTADAVLFSTPEYAGALPGSFKNLLDWTIGDDHVRSMYEKPVAWIVASLRGADHAYDSLRTVLGFAHSNIIEAACSHIPVTTATIDDDGLIADLDVRASWPPHSPRSRRVWTRRAPPPKRIDVGL
jgi:NAD(P)H-dependent FMN reductase